MNDENDSIGQRNFKKAMKKERIDLFRNLSFTFIGAVLLSFLIYEPDSVDLNECDKIEHELSVNFKKVSEAKIFLDTASCIQKVQNIEISLVY